MQQRQRLTMLQEKNENGESHSSFKFLKIHIHIFTKFTKSLLFLHFAAHHAERVTSIIPIKVGQAHNTCTEHLHLTPDDLEQKFKNIKGHRERC